MMRPQRLSGLTATVALRRIRATAGNDSRFFVLARSRFSGRSGMCRVASGGTEQVKSRPDVRGENANGC